MASKKLGKALSVNRNTGSFGSPAWSNMIQLKDVKVNRSPSNVIDTTDRAQSVETGLPTRYKVSVEADAIWSNGTGLDAIRDAFVAGTSVDLAILDGAATTSAKGLRGEWCVTKFAQKFPLSDGQMLSVQLQPYGNYTTGQYVSTYTDATVSAGTAETVSTKKRGKTAALHDSTHAAINGVMDFEVSLEWKLVNSSDRTTDFDTVIPTMRTVEVTASFIYDSSDAQIVAFKTAFDAHSVLELWALDGPYATAGSWGVHGDFNVTDFPLTASLTDGQMVTVKMVPAGNYTNAFEFVTTS